MKEEAPSKFMHWFAPLLGASGMGKGIVRKQTSKGMVTFIPPHNCNVMHAFSCKVIHWFANPIREQNTCIRVCS